MVKYSIGSNLAPLIRPITVLLPRAELDPRAEMSLNVRQNRLLMGLFWLKFCSNGSRRCWIRLWAAGLYYFKVRLIAVISQICHELAYLHRLACTYQYFLFFSLSHFSLNVWLISVSRLVFCELDILEFVAREECRVLYVNSNISFWLKPRFSLFPLNENCKK